jgi:nitroimidazol reductase NimA-like FMN-containing flavoprotein (pyridoxamine 5'-phosphate oxidase superfamily)
MPELLGAMSVGRIAYTTDDGPRVLPVNYVLEGESVVFRTVSDGEVHRHALETTCAWRWTTRSTSSTSPAGACWLSVACNC